MKVASLIIALLIGWTPATTEGSREISVADFPAQLFGAALCPDGKLVVGLGMDGGVYLWSFPSKEQIRRVDLGDDEISMAPVCSSDGKWIVIPTMKGAVVIVDRAAGAIRQKLTIGSAPIGQLALSPDSTLLAAAPWGKPGEIWDLRAGKKVAGLSANFGGTARLVFSPDGSLVASADEDTNIRFYNRAGQLRATTKDLLLESFAAEFTPDSKQLLVAGADHTVSFLDSATGRVVRQVTGPPDVTFVMSLSPDGKRLFTLQNDAASLQKPSMSLWDLQSGITRPVPVDASRAMRGAWASDGRLVVLITDGERKLTALAIE
jgi:WD40 repeat protein